MPAAAGKRRIRLVWSDRLFPDEGRGRAKTGLTCNATATHYHS
jgi:hypothetical protein